MSVLDLAHPGYGPGPAAVDTPCRSHDPELWFSDRVPDVERAQALCRGCPLRLACLAGALERREPWGVWGGEVFESGAVVPRKRPRGRPRKDAAAVEEAALRALEARLSDLERALAELDVTLDLARALTPDPEVAA